MRDGVLAVRAPCGIQQYVSIHKDVSPYNSENKRQEVIYPRINNWTNIEMNTEENEQTVIAVTNKRMHNPSASFYSRDEKL